MCGQTLLKYPVIEERSNFPIFWLDITPVILLTALITCNYILEEVHVREKMGGILNITLITFSAYNYYNTLKTCAGISLQINMHLHLLCESQIPHIF